MKKLAIFLDFKIAFETIDRSILLNKLYNYGIQESELIWFKSYLTDKKQMVKVNNYGVPQGSLDFTIFAN